MHSTCLRALDSQNHSGSPAHPWGAISASTISRVAQQLDTAVKAYHRRPLLFLDGIVLKRKTSMGAQKRSILVALEIRANNKKQIMNFCQAPAESQTSWKGCPNQLYRRGLTGTTLELIVRVAGGLTPHLWLWPAPTLLGSQDL